ncbi:transglutaminase family protein [Leptolyngbya sp. AN02str]|uniref:transglutaminase family protein n=1 Tax=Leptolyngbya sp. AN02str TaxID=3423363 RepID=UPI003D314EB9
MKYSITHTTTYQYTRPVTLAPHIVRLRPRCDVTQTLHRFDLKVTPEPTRITDWVDLDGNNLLHLYFDDEPLDHFSVTVQSEVETWRTNPFNFLLDPTANHLPFNYSSTLQARLQPYLGGGAGNLPTLDPVAIELGHELLYKTAGNPITFLWELSQRIHRTCQYTIRETGDPLPPSITWKNQSGSCRDFAILFAEVCRAVGLAARFVSGYQEGDPDWEDRHLHAWVEVYLPGAGWRGYDPTQALAVGDRHIALVAAPSSRETAPMTGHLKTGMGVQSHMSYKLTIDPMP